MHNSLFEFTFWTLWMIWFPTIFLKKKLFRSERNKMNLLTSIHMNVSNLYLHRRRKICLEILIGYFCYTHYLEQFNGSVLVASKRISHQFIRLLNSVKQWVCVLLLKCTGIECMFWTRDHKQAMFIKHCLTKKSCFPTGALSASGWKSLFMKRLCNVDQWSSRGCVR